MSSVDSAVDQEASPPEVKKIRLMSFNEMSPATKLHSNSVVFAKSGYDEDAVNIITKYFNDFAQLGQKQGFTLSIGSEEDYGTTVRLVESSSDFNSRKAFRAMDDLIERKSDQDERVEKELKKTRKKLTKQRQRQDKINEEMGGKLEILSKKKDDHSKELARIKSVVKDLQNSVVKELQNSVVEDTVYIRFFSGPCLSTMCKNELLERICTHLLSLRSKGTLFDVSLEKRKRRLLGYIKFLQTRMFVETPVYLCLAKLFYHKNMLYKPTMAEKIHWRSVFNSKDVCGSVHYVWLRDGCMCLAIVDKMIVSYSSTTSHEGALSRLHSSLKRDSDWSTKFRFCTPEKPSKDFDMFVKCPRKNKELYDENEKVVTWIENNFKCIRWPHHNGHEASLVGLYNICHQYVIDSSF